MELCVSCDKVLGVRQHSFVCGLCGGKHHRTCTGVTLKEFRRLQSENAVTDVTCRRCLLPTVGVEESMEVDDEAAEFVEYSFRQDVAGDADDDAGVAEEANDTGATDYPFRPGDDADDDADVTEEAIDTGATDYSFRPGDDADDDADVAGDADASFRANDTIGETRVILERSMTDRPPAEVAVEDRPLEFEKLPGATQRGRDLLVDSLGYTYTLKDVRGRTTNWWCSVRTKTVKCSAAVRERDGAFIRNDKLHAHPHDPNRPMTAKICKEAKEVGVHEPFKAAKTIVEAMSVDEVPEEREEPVPVPDIDLITRRVNRHRQKTRPIEPKDMSFELAEDHIPDGFFRKEVQVDGFRHLIFFTETQLGFLQTTQRWYIDGTFKVMREPFKMLFSIHAFVRRGDSAKQIPLAFVTMTRRTTKDYVKVFQAIGRLLQGEIVVEGFVADFEVGMWKALKLVFPGALVQGCAFHWEQAIWRKVQEKGLSAAYMEQGTIHWFIRRLMCLPFMPPTHARSTFEFMSDLSPEHSLTPLLDYIRRTWFESTVWSRAEWSMYEQSVRTNNDCEGWHRRLNYKANGTPPFYLTLKLLHQEAQVARLQSILVSEQRLKRYQRRCDKSSQGNIFALWARYRVRDLTSTGLLREVTLVYKPRVHVEAE